MKRHDERGMSTEMPYERGDYICVVDQHARDAYLHLAKLLLYKDTTHNADGWINDIVNKFTLPMLTAKAFVSTEARARIIYKGYIVNFFGSQFEDYDEQMENFCHSAIWDMEAKAKKEGTIVPKHDDIEQSISSGKNIIVAYAQEIAKITNGTKQPPSNTTLQRTLRTEAKQSLNIDV